MANQYSNPHGMTGTKFYGIWCSMKGRCRYPKTNGFENYGGRGIKVCDKWQKFKGFMEDMYSSYIEHSNREETTSIERIDVNGDYCKENCEWVSLKEQYHNKRTSRFVTYNGETLTLVEMCRKHGIDYVVALKRIAMGWDIKDIIEKPTRILAPACRGKDAEQRSVEMATVLVEKRCTVQDVAKEFNVSVTTVSNSIKKILPYINGDLYQQAVVVIAYNKAISHLRAGEAAKKKLKGVPRSRWRVNA